MATVKFRNWIHQHSSTVDFRSSNISRWDTYLYIISQGNLLKIENNKLKCSAETVGDFRLERILKSPIPLGKGYHNIVTRLSAVFFNNYVGLSKTAGNLIKVSKNSRINSRNKNWTQFSVSNENTMASLSTDRLKTEVTQAMWRHNRLECQKHAWNPGILPHLREQRRALAFECMGQFMEHLYLYQN